MNVVSRCIVCRTPRQQHVLPHAVPPVRSIRGHSILVCSQARAERRHVVCSSGTDLGTLSVHRQVSVIFDIIELCKTFLHKSLKSLASRLCRMWWGAECCDGSDMWSVKKIVYDFFGYEWLSTTMSEVTRSVLVLRLSWKWIGRGVKMFKIVTSCTWSVNGIGTMLTLF